MCQPVELLQFPLLLEGMFSLVPAISKHFIHIKAVGLRWHTALAVALPMVCKQIPPLRAQTLRLHTKRCMGVIVGHVELGIIVQLQDCICYCIMNPFNVYKLPN
jgi:hypothetical protein